MKEKVSLEKDDHKELPKWHYEVSGEVRVWEYETRNFFYRYLYYS
jgi:hypothetical protein